MKNLQVPACELAFDEGIDHIEVRLAQEVLRFVDDHRPVTALSVDSRRISSASSGRNIVKRSFSSTSGSSELRPAVSTSSFISE